MNKYVVYFANNEEYLSGKEFEFEYSVDASNEEEAKQRAIKLFQVKNPSLNLSNYTYGFKEN